MRIKLLCTTGLIAAVGAVVAVAPALTAASGTVAVTVVAEAPIVPIPCLTVTPDTLDFGTLPLSTGQGPLSSGHRQVDVASCGSSSQMLYVGATDATGTSGTWSLAGAAHPCPSTSSPPNRFGLVVGGDNGQQRLAVQLGSPQPWTSLGTGLAVDVELDMPCAGSSGIGEPRAFHINFTAVVS
jgi:hypothetical protein